MRVQNKIIILNSIVNTIEGDPYDHLMSMRIFTLIMNKIIISATQITRKLGMVSTWMCKPNARGSGIVRN